MRRQSPGNGWTSQLVVHLMSVCPSPWSLVEVSIEKQSIHQDGLNSSMAHFPISAISGIPQPLVPFYHLQYHIPVGPFVLPFGQGQGDIVRGSKSIFLSPQIFTCLERCGREEDPGRVGCPRNPVSLPVLLSNSQHSNGDFVPIGCRRLSESEELVEMKLVRSPSGAGF